MVKRFHPEGIPWPASCLYNAFSKSGIFLRHYELVARDVSSYVETGGHILDIGTGPGQLLLTLRRQCPRSKLFGADISPAMIAQARKNIKAGGYGGTIDVTVAAADALPFRDSFFDCVVSTGSLHHWKDPVHALKEVYRVLKNGASALLYDLVHEMPKAAAEEIRKRFGGFRLALLWLHSFEEPFFSPGEMETLGRQSEFLVEGTHFTGALCCLVLKKSAD